MTAQRKRTWTWVFWLAMVGQLVALYLPSLPSGVGFPHADKVVHTLIFAAPALVGMLAGMRSLLLGLGLGAHAVASEVVQHYLLTERAGDPWDSAAGILGVTIGLLLGWPVQRRSRVPSR
ncbi:hypothetical protein [Agrococcus carbonis]|uniref:VanZ like family protein n=1 Tax=Agrococcus carbonis TaxID=684552 RepID=A0A1H1Q1L7_9MICO|nr:hypothetical protein [Agrococcus carbonis]SDS17296.1 hypothetical protein SAMN04489719_1706 [Agrococcus carbonis]